MTSRAQPSGIRGQVYERLVAAGETGVKSNDLEDLVSPIRLGLHLESLRAEGHQITSIWKSERARGYYHVTLHEDAWA